MLPGTRFLYGTINQVQGRLRNVVISKSLVRCMVRRGCVIIGPPCLFRVLLHDEVRRRLLEYIMYWKLEYLSRTCLLLNKMLHTHKHKSAPCLHKGKCVKRCCYCTAVVVMPWLRGLLLISSECRVLSSSCSLLSTNQSAPFLALSMLFLVLSTVRWTYNGAPRAPL